MSTTSGLRAIGAGLLVTSTWALGCSGTGPDPVDQGEPVARQSAAYTTDPTQFTLPAPDTASRTAILSKYTNIDPQGQITRGLLEDALEFYDINKAIIANQAFIVVVDFSLFSGSIRFWLVDMSSGQVEPHMVAHGAGSDPNATGYATIFSNTSGSHMSSLGFYLGGEIYDGTHVHSMRLDGLSADGSPNNMANTNVRSRLVVMHEASYVSDSNTGAQGRSDGCLALDPSIEVEVVDKLTGGALIYAETAPLNTPIGPLGSSSSSSGGSSSSGSGSSSGGGSSSSSSGSGGSSGGSSSNSSSGATSSGSSGSSGGSGGTGNSSGSGTSTGSSGGGSGGGSTVQGDSNGGWGRAGSSGGCSLGAAPNGADLSTGGFALAALALAAARRRNRRVG